VKRILVTGSTGQIGTELVAYLREVYGASNVIAFGRRVKEGSSVVEERPYYGLASMTEDMLNALQERLNDFG